MAMYRLDNRQEILHASLEGKALTFVTPRSKLVTAMYLRLPVLIFLLTVSSLVSSQTVYRVPIHDVIDLGLPSFVQRAIDEAEKESASALIFDVDTFGGRVDGATKIKDAILSCTVPTVAFVNRRAISAGALISLSCEKVVMTGGGTLGAVTAVDLSGKKASEKVISYMREEMASTAEIRGRSPLIAQAMVDEEIAFETVVVNGDTIVADDLHGSKEGKLVTLSTEKALKYKMADETFETFAEILEWLELEDARVIDLRVNWSEKLVRFLTDPMVSSLLMTLGFLGLLFELQSPGWGIPGTIGIVCLSLFFGATLFTDLAELTELLIILVGVALVLVEIFLIPGFGLIGILGGAVILAGFFMILLPAHPFYLDYRNALRGLAIGVVGGMIGLILMGRVLIRTKFWQKITLPISERSSEGYNTSIGLEDLRGERGVAVTDLRPSGWVTVGNQKIFVVSEGEFISNGGSVRILTVDGNRVVVRKTSSSEEQSQLEGG
ncbi:MAG: NfeD family protein [Candidatus Neomarinimicrobiota bacterium]